MDKEKELNPIIVRQGMSTVRDEKRSAIRPETGAIKIVGIAKTKR